MHSNSTPFQTFLTYLLHGAQSSFRSWLLLQLDKKFLTFYGSRKFITVLTSTPYTKPNPSSPHNPPHFLKIHLIILPSTSGSPQLSPSLRFHHQNPVHTTIRAICLAYLILLDFRLQFKCDGTRAENRFCLSAKRTSPFKSEGASVKSNTGSRGVRINCSNAEYTKFRGCEGSWLPTQYATFPSLPLPCVALCHHVSTGLYHPYIVG
jgi:hypothetical protein